MSIPIRQQAEGFLEEAAQRNPGPWETHSRYVAQAAEIIASDHPRINPDYAYIFGLLHDIGRREGVHGMRHIIDGYRFLASKGFEQAARYCLTHSYPIEGLAVGSSDWDGTPEEYQFVSDYLQNIQYDDYDRLIQVCDAICLPSGFCLMEKRLVDVVIRYGVDPHTADRWRAFYRIKEQIEDTIGGSIYKNLPNVIENTFAF